MSEEAGKAGDENVTLGEGWRGRELNWNVPEQKRR